MTQLKESPEVATPEPVRVGWTDAPNLLRGFLMGGADIIPGVSGGTVALILGIYERLVTAISRFDSDFVRLVLKRRFWEAAGHVDLRFLLTLGLGILVGIGSLAGLMHHLLEHHLLHTLAVFFGLILASSWLVFQMIRRRTVGAMLAGICGSVFAYWLVAVNALNDPPDGLWYVFVTGMIAICAMILPGISGAFLMVLMGKYQEITGLLSISEWVQGKNSLMDAATLGVFGLGAATGLLSFSRVLRWMLGRHRDVTLSVLCGFMLGSLRRIWPFKTELKPGSGGLQIDERSFANVFPDLTSGFDWISLGLILVAIGFIMALDWSTRRRRDS